MLNFIIRTALSYRLLTVCLSLAVIVVGSVLTVGLPIDVLPNLTRPRVTLVTECAGLAPEEVEQRVTFPLETAITGAPGVTSVRSSSDIGLSMIQVDFDWGANIYTSRQIIQERISMVRDRLPANVELHMGPISSLLGQIMTIGMWSEDGSTNPLELRTQADWVVRQRLLTIPGVSQVISMGGGRKQYQVLVDQHLMHQYEVSLQDVQDALQKSNLNVTGGYVSSEANELLIRGLGMVKSIDDIRRIVVRNTTERPILIENVAEVREEAQQKRGDSSVNGRDAVVLTIQKQPGADTREVTDAIHEALDSLKSALPPDVRLESTYEQRDFIDYSVRNVVEALRDGAILVVIVLFLFLLNFRTTFITLTAIPLSILVTGLVFHWFEMSINVMTLGGIAVALGELVDDAIVDVENIFRRLRQNRQSDNPKPVLQVIFYASVEVRNAIIISTILVIVVFAPLFALSGLAGRMFAPLGVAYIISILASTVVSLTVTPVLSYYLLPAARATAREGDGFLLRSLKQLAEPLIRFSMSSYGTTIALSTVLIGFLLSVIYAVQMGKDFLPKFDEGAAQVNLFAPPGTSLPLSRELTRMADRNLAKLLQSEQNPDGPVRWFTCRTGRAELDEHVMGVNTSEYVLSLNPDSGLSRQQIEAELMAAVEDIPGVETEVEQPIYHLISHMLSGVTAQIAIKLYGDDLDVLRREAKRIEQAIADVPSIKPPVIEQQDITPQFRIELDSDRLAYYGIQAQFVQDFVETAMHGRVVSQVFDGQRSFDLMLRLAEPYRNDLANFHRTPLELPSGKIIPLDSVARVYESGGPNTIKRDDGRRRIVIRVNTIDRDLSGVMSDLESRISPLKLPEGYFVMYGGQFQAQQEASQRILLLSIVALVAVFVVLYSAFPSRALVLQILIALPAAFIGGMIGLKVTGQTMSTAAMVGFISLGGIAARNGLLLMSTYLDGMRESGFSQEMILRGSLERLAPVLMTALTTGIGLIPLVIGGHLPGKEILFPVATVILGGLVTATLCEFLVRPGLFWNFGGDAARQLTDEQNPAHIDARPLPSNQPATATG